LPAGQSRDRARAGVSRRRKVLAPLALVLASIVSGLVISELLLRGSVPCLPLRYQKYLPDEI
jgi:hypothetical protein